jgi:uncharacterized protein YegL
VTTLPFYLVVDNSMSMSGAPIDSLNTAMAVFLDTIVENPIIADKARVSVISFSDDARVEVPLTRPAEVVNLPTLRARGGTEFGAAFRLLRERVENDVEELKAAGERVHRPVVFFITDGSPTDPGWERALMELTDREFRAHPTIFAIGFQAAEPAVLQEIAGPSGRAFVLTSSVAPADAVRSILESATRIITSSVIGSVGGERPAAIALPSDWISLSALPDDTERV